MPDCIFCNIVKGKLPATIVYRDEYITAFLDIHPVAPTHILIIPNKHIASVDQLLPEDGGGMGRLFSVARGLAEREGIHKDGYRLIVNTGTHGGQVVHPSALAPDGRPAHASPDWVASGQDNLRGVGFSHPAHYPGFDPERSPPAVPGLVKSVIQQRSTI